MIDGCEVLDWAASGAMALTGQPDGAPVPSPAPVLAMLGAVTDEFAQVTKGGVQRRDIRVMKTGQQLNLAKKASNYLISHRTAWRQNL